MPATACWRDDRTVYGVNAFTERIAIRRGFTPGRGYRLFARHHDADKDAWSKRVPVRICAMVLAGETLFFAGDPEHRQTGVDARLEVPRDGNPIGEIVRMPQKRMDFRLHPHPAVRERHGWVVLDLVSDV